MTDPLTSFPSPQTSAQPAPRRRFAAVTVAVALTGAAATQAFSQRGFGPPWARPGFMGPGFMGGRLDPAQAEDKADGLVRHFAIEIDATPQQQDRLRDLIPLR